MKISKVPRAGCSRSTQIESVKRHLPKTETTKHWTFQCSSFLGLYCFFVQISNREPKKNVAWKVQARGESCAKCQLAILQGVVCGRALQGSCGSAERTRRESVRVNSKSLGIQMAQNRIYKYSRPQTK